MFKIFHGKSWQDIITSILSFLYRACHRSNGFERHNRELIERGFALNFRLESKEERALIKAHKEFFANRHIKIMQTLGNE